MMTLESINNQMSNRAETCAETRIATVAELSTAAKEVQGLALENPAIRQSLMSSPRDLVNRVLFMMTDGQASVDPTVNFHIHEESFKQINLIVPAVFKPFSNETSGPEAVIFQRAQRDDTFKAQLFREPKAAVETALLTKLPEEVSVKVHQNSSEDIHFKLSGISTVRFSATVTPLLDNLGFERVIEMQTSSLLCHHTSECNKTRSGYGNC